MVGRIVGMASLFLCAFPFFIMSMNKESSEPINFWSGDTSLKDKVKDIKGYNIEIAGLYKKCGLFFFLTGIITAIFPIVGMILTILGCSVGIYFVYRVYMKILKKYS